MSAPNTLATDLTLHLTSKSLSPTPVWLTTFLSSIRPATPLQALKQTALFRILASDITQTTSWTLASVFPPDVHSGQIRERSIPGPLVVQVLDVEDIGTSRWSQVQEIEARERGEYTRGREVIRVVPGEEGEGGTQGGQGQPQQQGEKKSWGPHKLLLQDAKGQTVYGIELVKVDKIGLDMNIGAKIVLRDVVVARGVIMLEPRSTEVLGGKIEELFKVWKEGRKERLTAAAGIQERG